MLFFILDLVGLSFDFLDDFSFILVLISMVSFLFYYYGFFVLGKKTNSGLLKISSILSIVMVAVFIVLFILAMVSSFSARNLYQVGFGSSGFEVPAIEESSLGLRYLFLAFFLFLVGVRGLFTISLIKVRNTVKYAFPAGILGLISIFIIAPLSLYLLYNILFDPGVLLMFILSIRL